jgi:16S rRNA (cytosine1402-N4)-methyltransferase
VTDELQPSQATSEHRRRPRYRGKNPRRFEEKYKEHNPERYAHTVAKILASGKTPAGTHRPIMVAEVLEILAPRPGETAVDCTLGYGGHAVELLARLHPGGHLLGLDADPLELPKTEARLRALGYGPDAFTAHRSNFAGLNQVLAKLGRPPAGVIVADLGLSSMQLDNPARGFSLKRDGPLDMRMNPARGQTASEWLRKVEPDAFAALLVANADEPYAHVLATALAKRTLPTTSALKGAIKSALPRIREDDRELVTRRVFQALRIAVNDELSALDSLLRHLPECLRPGGRVAILSFHSGEDRRVKKAFEAGLRQGLFDEIAPEVLRASVTERRDNPRSASAKLRWARRAAGPD